VPISFSEAFCAVRCGLGLDPHQALTVSIAGDNVPPALQQRAAELERKRLSTMLSHHLEQRPPPSDLAHRNILKGNRVAP
jgi:hypothetical protein